MPGGIGTLLLDCDENFPAANLLVVVARQFAFTLAFHEGSDEASNGATAGNTCGTGKNQGHGAGRRSQGNCRQTSHSRPDRCTGGCAPADLGMRLGRPPPIAAAAPLGLRAPEFPY